MLSPKCKWGVLQAGSTELAELLLSHLLGAHPEAAADGKGGCVGFHLLLHKQRLLQGDILHHSQVAKEPSLNPFLQITPETQEPSPMTSLFEPDSHFSQSTADLCALGCCVPQSLLWFLSLFPLIYTCLMQIHRNKLFLFSCLEESLISVRLLLPITPVTHHWRQEHRDCRKKKKYIYLHP